MDGGVVAVLVVVLVVVEMKAEAAAVAAFHGEAHSTVVEVAVPRWEANWPVVVAFVVPPLEEDEVVVELAGEGGACRRYSSCLACVGR